MSSWLFHGMLGSLGLALGAACAGALLLVWRRQPLASYRLVVLVLIGALVLPVCQVLAERWELPRALPFAEELATIRASWSERTATAPVEDKAPPVVGLEPAEAELLLLGTLLSSPELLESVAEDDALTGAAAPAPAASLTPERSPWRIERGAVLGVLAAAYLAGLALALARSALRLGRTRRLLRHAEPLRDARMLAIWRELAAASPLRHRVRIFTTPEIQVPMCFGLRRPAILLPAAEDPALDPEVLRCVLLHELVHLERRDTWIMLAQELLRSVFWFHPAAWWLCRKIDALRELSCDFVVVARTGRRKRYASALVEYAAWMRRGLAHPDPDPVPATALLPWTSTNSQLARRIEMLVTLPSPRFRRSRRATFLAAIAFFACLWGGQLALAAATVPAQEPVPEPPAAPEPPATPEPPRLRIDSEPMLVPRIGLVPRVELAPVLSLAPRVRVGLPKLELRAPLTLSLPALAVPRAPLAAPVPMPAQEDEQPLIGVRIGRMEDDTLEIDEVIAGSLAERSGMQDGDVIVRIDREPATWRTLQEAKRRLAGGRVVLRILRGGDPIEIELDGADWPRRVRPRLREARDPVDEGLRQAMEALKRAAHEHPDDESLHRALDALHRAQDERAHAQHGRADAEEAYDRARRYYHETNPESFKSDLHEAMEGYRKRLHEGRADDTQRYVEALKRLHDVDVKRYLEDARKWFDEGHEAGEARQRAEKALRYALDEQKQARAEAERRREDAEHGRADARRERPEIRRERRADRADRDDRPEVYWRTDSEREHMESDLQKLRVELQRRLDELEILRKKLDSLEKLDRAGSARHEPVDEVPPSELGEPGELAEAEPVEPPAEPTGSGVR